MPLRRRHALHVQHGGRPRDQGRDRRSGYDLALSASALRWTHARAKKSRRVPHRDGSASPQLLIASPAWCVPPLPCLRPCSAVLGNGARFGCDPNHTRWSHVAREMLRPISGRIRTCRHVGRHFPASSRLRRRPAMRAWISPARSIRRHCCQPAGSGSNSDHAKAFCNFERQQNSVLLHLAPSLRGALLRRSNPAPLFASLAMEVWRPFLP
ncbi:hypothetical protein ACVW16_002260 [Bradyrhizobium sp. USDA 4474]